MPPVRSIPSSSPRARRAMASGESIGDRRVVERVWVEKSWRRIFRVTVRANSPAARSRAATWRASRAQITVSVSRSTRSVSKVSSTEMDFVSRSGSTGRSSRAYARSARPWACALPRIWLSSRVDTCCRSATVRTPIRCSFSSVTGPTPGMTLTASGSIKRHLGARGHHHQPVGLAELGGQLGDELGAADADRGGQTPGGRGHRRLEVGDQQPQSGVGELDRSVGLGQVDERLVQRQRLHRGGQLPQDPHHLATGRSVGLEPAGQEGGVRRPPAGLVGRHGRADAEPTRLVRRRGHHATLARPADDHGLAAQRGLVALLDRREERVEVEVQHGGLGAHQTILTGGPPQNRAVYVVAVTDWYLQPLRFAASWPPGNNGSFDRREERPDGQLAG